jgi:hypothetical protein
VRRILGVPKKGIASSEEEDPPHLKLYLSGEPPGSSSLDAIPFWGIPRILLT